MFSWRFLANLSGRLKCLQLWQRLMARAKATCASRPLRSLLLTLSWRNPKMLQSTSAWLEKGHRRTWPARHNRRRLARRPNLLDLRPEPCERLWNPKVCKHKQPADDNAAQTLLLLHLLLNLLLHLLLNLLLHLLLLQLVQINRHSRWCCVMMMTLCSMLLLHSLAPLVPLISLTVCLSTLNSHQALHSFKLPLSLPTVRWCRTT